MQQAQRHAWRRLQLSRPRGAPHGHYVRGLAQLSRTSTQLPRSGIRDVMEQASAREENGERIIHLEVGQPDLLPPQHVQEASAASALAPERSGSARYCPNPGVADARAAAAEYFERRAPGVRTLPEQIMVTPGAVMAIAATYACVLDAGDEVLVPDPGWPNYRMAAELYNATPVSYACPAEDGWLPNVDQMADAVTNKTRLLLLNNPSNPAGVCLPPPLLAEILAMAHEKDLFVLSDEIYSDLAPPGEASPPSVLSYDMSEEDQERLIVVSGVSKAYSMCGYRVGFLRAQPALIDTANKVVETLISCTSPASQAGMVAALRGPQDCVGVAAAQYDARRQAVLSLLRERGRFEYEPGGAFYILLGVGGEGGALDIMEHCQVAVAPGETFGMESSHHVRVSLCSAEAELLEGVARICEWLDASGR